MRPPGFLRDRRGAVAMLGALSVTMLVALGALAVDAGSIFLQTRQLQGMADLAALGAADDLSNAQAAAQATASNNGWTSPVQAATVLGAYSPDPTLSASARFSPGGANPNAVKVTLTAQANLFFGQMIMGKPTVTITRTATAAVAQLASFSIGSGLLNLQGGVENALLSGLTGSTVSLSAANYNALANANVDLLQYSQALQTRLSLTGASFNQALSTSVSTGSALGALASTLTSAGQTSAGQAINTLATASGSTPSVDLQQLINLGPYGGQDHATGGATSGISINALQLAMAILELAQGGRQVQLSLGAVAPGLSTVTAWLAIGQRPSNSPWLTVADDGSVTIATAQMRLYMDAQVGTSAPLNLLGASLNVPIYVELASAEAKLSSLNCSASGSTPAVILSAEPSLGQIALAQVSPATLSNFTQPVTQSPAALLTAPLVSVTGQADVVLGGGQSWQSVAFTQSDIQSLAIKTVQVNNLAAESIASLLGQTSVQVQVLGVGLLLTPSQIGSATTSALIGVGSTLDGVLNSITGLLGVQLGVADLQVNGLRCNASALVA